ncbi:putative lalv9 family protein [Phaeoacremonium minimum UCRPA7]|uniref:Putative lalv9 family protein n=1 Tax=Phaeoacremonium minimum (strain UCR-PA7) TaxID=1286976 RepID=R8BHW6_PHAM7|nr:putative lalv9 family protein [Phaeoacremonium minimum UCRPA7]EON98935.1 putative lalv9 family protein [Phaeoacremonium minimum UCRPA7]
MAAPLNGTNGAEGLGAEPPKSPGKVGFIPLVTVVDFHHLRGPEVETWFGVAEDSDPAAENNWTLLPFMALSDGAHAERLGIVTKAWFAQRNFSDIDILRHFQESLAEEKRRGLLNGEEDGDQYLGMSLREMVHEFRWQTLVLLKCCLLQPKDCADPELNGYEKNLSKPTSLRTSDRGSMLSYMGLPLQVFGKGSLFGPYTPLQQLDLLADRSTKSYIVGSTNSLLLQQKDRYSDVLINLDDDTINITSTSLRAALQLSVPDRRWIDFITQAVNDTWDDANPGRPKTMGYVGSEEFIRLQFEDYLLGLISSVKYHNILVKHGNDPRMTLPHIEGDPSIDFGTEWVEMWMRTENYRIWDANTEDHLVSVVEPKHLCAGGLTIDDVQRRLAQQVQDLHLDERFAQGREVLGRNLAAGRDKASTMFNKLYADMEALREAQRRRAEEAKANESRQPTDRNGQGFGAVDLSKAQQTVQSVGVRAGAYMSSWASWAGEKRKAAGWGRSSGSSAASGGSGGSGGGWGLGGSRGKNKKEGSILSTDSQSEKEVQMGLVKSPRMSTSSARTGDSEKARPFVEPGLAEKRSAVVNSG